MCQTDTSKAPISRNRWILKQLKSMSSPGWIAPEGSPWITAARWEKKIGLRDLVQLRFTSDGLAMVSNQLMASNLAMASNRFQANPMAL